MNNAALDCTVRLRRLGGLNEINLMSQFNKFYRLDQ